MLVSRASAAGACLTALVFGALPAAAAPPEIPAELQQLKDQLADLRRSYDERLQALERRIAELQQTGSGSGDLGATAKVPSAATPASAASLAAAAPSAFNPAVSVILNGTYANLSRHPETYRLQGFIPGGEAGPGKRGFQLGESELWLSANIDPAFSGRLTLALAPDNSVSVEEALFEQQGLFEGATLSGGRFLSSIGYLNSQHAHAWDFVDAPLVYQAFFGGQLRTDGVGLHWLAPTERFLEIGAELGSGASFPGNDTHRNGIGSTALFAHLGDDIGDSASWRAGISLLRNRAVDRSYADSDAAGLAVTNAFTGNSRTWGLDGVYKWAPGGNAMQRNLKIQGEYFQRRESGALGYDVESPASQSGDYRANQSGWYLQTVYQFMPRWRVGARYDRLNSGVSRLGLVDSGALTAADFSVLGAFRPSRGTLMVDYSLSEFSRFRLQLAADRSSPAGTDRQVFLQYIMSLGAHGAHSY